MHTHLPAEADIHHEKRRKIMRLGLLANMGIAGMRLWQAMQGGGGAAVFGSQFIEGSDSLLYEGSHHVAAIEHAASTTNDPEERAKLKRRAETWRKRMLGTVAGLAIMTGGYGIYEMATNEDVVTGSEIAWSLAGVTASSGIAFGMARYGAKGEASASRDVWRHATTDAAVGHGPGEWGELALRRLPSSFAGTDRGESGACVTLKKPGSDDV